MLKYLFAKTDSTAAPDKQWLDVPGAADVFTYHQKNAGRALLAGLLLAAIVEAVVLHVLISMWNHWVAWAATVATIWFVLQVIAQIRAVGMRPIYVHEQELVLRNGAFDLASIPVAEIASVEKSMKEVKPHKDQPVPLNVGFPASHNVVIELKSPQEARILNRKKRQFQIALLAIDDADRFVQLIRDEIV